MGKLARPFYVTILFSVLSFQASLQAQIKIEGKVIESEDHPIPNASIKVTNHNEGIVSNGEGFFSFRVRSVTASDTLIISSVGYQPLKIPVLNAVKKGRFVLQPFSTSMETVVVRSFGKEDIAGVKTDKVGYFRGWNADNKGAEIGRSVYVPHKEYQVSKVRFKIYCSCDTAIIRVRIREMNGQLPGKELLKDSVAVLFKHAAVADKTYDFDLLKYNLILKKKEIFVSFEVLQANTEGKDCSMAFAGSEQGSYLYKSSATGEWNVTDDYTIHMKVFFRYD